MFIAEAFGMTGRLVFYERRKGARRWRKVLEADNIVLNGFYNDLLTEMANGVQVGVSLQVGALALGTGTTAPARTDTGLAAEWVSAANTVPQRMAPTQVTINTADPPLTTWSFYLPAGANSVAFQINEAGLLYNNPSLTPGGAGKFASHALFSYNKPVNTDLRIDYQLQRSLT